MKSGQTYSRKIDGKNRGKNCPKTVIKFKKLNYQ